MSMIAKLKSMVEATVRTAQSHLPASVADTPVPQLFACNASPSETERLLILQMVELRGREVENIDRRLELPEWNRAAFKKLINRRDANVDFIQRHKLLLSPIRRLPPDILMDILFLLHRSKTPRFDRSPRWVLAQVCRSWRSIILSMPGLWSTIRLDFSQPRRTIRASLKYLQIMLDRSSDHLLKISLISGPTSTRSAILDALSSVIPASERWEEFSISAPYDVIASLDRTPLKLPSLRVLDLKYWNDTGKAPPHEIVIHTFKDCPVLHSASITGTGANICPLLRYRQLNSLGVSSSDLSIVQAVVRSYPQITTLSVAIVNLSLVTSPQKKSLDMPSIKRLSLFFPDPTLYGSEIAVGMSVLIHLVLPCIKEITTTNLPSALIPYLTALLERSAPASLDKLCLLGTPSGPFPATPGDITKLLEACPELVDLEIPLPPLTDLSSLFINRTPTVTRLVSSLQSLTFHSNEFEWNPAFIQILQAITQSRREAAPISHRPTMRAIRICFPTVDACLNSFAMLRDVRVGYGRIYLEDVYDTLRKVLESLLEAPTKENWVVRNLRRNKTATTCIQRLQYVVEFSEDAQVDDAKTLYRSKLHHAMFEFIQVKDTAIPGERKHKFKEQALQILRQWCRLLLADASNCDWGFESLSTLIYIPADDPIRQSDLQVLNMIFGLDEPSELLGGLILEED